MYFLYFDRTDLMYTGIADDNQLIMSFERSLLVKYYSSDLDYPQKFGQYAYHQERITDEDLAAVAANQDWEVGNEKLKKYREQFKL